MKKEQILAIVIGAVVGLVLALFIVSRRGEKVENNLPQKKEVKELPTSTQAPVRSIKVSSPVDKQVVKDNTLTLKAEVPKESLVVIVGPGFQKALFSENGKIEETIELVIGENRIKIYAYPTSPGVVNLEKEVVVYYLGDNL